AVPKASEPPLGSHGRNLAWALDGDRTALGSNGDVDSRVTRVGGRDRRRRACQVNT
ncbi:hypothetical protein GBF38_011552, partial [Nibea albiflora]